VPSTKRLILREDLRPGDCFAHGLCFEHGLRGHDVFFVNATRRHDADHASVNVRCPDNSRFWYHIGEGERVSVGYTNRQAKRQRAKLRRRARIAEGRS
jgi:hypothetical protein